ncbi:MAG: hypothetical protein KVP17_002339 [Porospora cf. gigantea B]|uniref:uncharacterized protein n=1 Tax=Porospora cf. gigantea B TaxID=2853592 RepID=UPI003571962E|nr:MAG: hypothetical protein KVP17_002339 [Porospora cf. gigantea B]
MYCPVRLVLLCLPLLAVDVGVVDLKDPVFKRLGDDSDFIPTEEAFGCLWKDAPPESESILLNVDALRPFFPRGVDFASLDPTNLPGYPSEETICQATEKLEGTSTFTLKFHAALDSVSLALEGLPIPHKLYTALAPCFKEALTDVQAVTLQPGNLEIGSAGLRRLLTAALRMQPRTSMTRKQLEDDEAFLRAALMVTSAGAVLLPHTFHGIAAERLHMAEMDLIRLAAKPRDWGAATIICAVVEGLAVACLVLFMLDGCRRWKLQT